MTKTLGSQIQTVRSEVKILSIDKEENDPVIILVCFYACHISKQTDIYVDILSKG